MLESEGSPLPLICSKREKPFGILLFHAGDVTFGDPFAVVSSFSAILRYIGLSFSHISDYSASEKLRELRGLR